jgi:hypothetical protein
MHRYREEDINIFSLWNGTVNSTSDYWNFKTLLTNCPGFGGGTFSNDLRSSKGWLFNIKRNFTS